MFCIAQDLILICEKDNFTMSGLSDLKEYNEVLSEIVQFVNISVFLEYGIRCMSGIGCEIRQVRS